MWRRGNRSAVPLFFWSRRSPTAPTGAESEGQMSQVRPDPAPKPDQIRTLRDLAAGFVRAIDRTALEFEAVATSELTERVACLVTLHEMEATSAELTKTPTKLLRDRLNLLRQVGRAEQEVDYSTRRSTNGELRKRIEYLRQVAAAEAADADYKTITDEVLTDINNATANELKARRRAKKAKAKAEAKADPRFLRTVEADPVFGLSSTRKRRASAKSTPRDPADCPDSGRGRWEDKNGCPSRDDTCARPTHENSTDASGINGL